MADPYRIANDLVKALKQTDQYQKILEIKKQIEKNKAYENMLNDYKSITVNIESLKLQGQKLSPENENKLDELTNIIHSIPLLKDYLDAEEEFGMIFQDIQHIIYMPIAELFEDIKDMDD